ncbi:MAG: hypothetical protein KGJ93_02940 [Patescibacteria group bacterium]|nr:hypothetical protein [Patescibacteria group bacterium]
MDFEREILEIKRRNQRVELDKAWERSRARRLLVSAITYLTAAVWLIWIGDTMPWLKALVPVAGFILSTLTLPSLKRWWVKHYQI